MGQQFHLALISGVIQMSRRLSLILGKRFDTASTFAAKLLPTLESFGLGDYQCLMWNRWDVVDRGSVLFRATKGTFIRLPGPVSTEIETLHQDLMEESVPLVWQGACPLCPLDLPFSTTPHENFMSAGLSTGMLRMISVLQGERRADASIEDICMLGNICAVVCCDLWHREEQRKANTLVTDREREVLKWLGMCKSANEVAAIMEVSVNTINFHARNISSKLNTSNRMAAVQWAMANDLI